MRGDKDQREYPWGDDWSELKCNSSELGLGGTSPVGFFTSGASPYGCLDMVGNVWEWTSSLWGKDELEFKYPYKPGDARENLSASNDVRRVLRGCSWDDLRVDARCAYRFGNIPDYWYFTSGFRVVVSLAEF